MTSPLQEIPHEETTTTREWAAVNLNPKELLDGLSKSQQQILLYDGATCKFTNVAGSDEAGSSQSTCLALALSYVQVAFDLEGSTSRFNLKEELVEEMFAIKTIDKCLALDEALHTRPQSVENLIDLPPFRDAISKVLLVHQECSYNGLLAMLQQMWDNAPHVPVVAGVITYLQETILCLRLQFGGIYIYCIFDPHTRPNRPRGPAFILNSSREATATYLKESWNFPTEVSLDEEDGDELRLFSTHILLPNKNRLQDTKEQNLTNDLSSPVLKVELPQELASKEELPSQLPNGISNAEKIPKKVSTKIGMETNTSDDSQSIKASSLRSSVSRNRLQQEFGWQLTLQSQKRSMPTHEEASEEQPSGNEVQSSFPPKVDQTKIEDHAAKEEDKAAKELQSKDESSPDPTKQAKLRSPPRARAANRSQASSFSQASPTRNLAKKDIGWQLALQQMAKGTKAESEGELKAEKKEEMTADLSTAKAEMSPIKAKPKSPNGSFTPTNNRKESKARSRGQHQPQTLHSQSPRRQPPRDDFGWQMGLSAKSLTLASSSSYRYDEASSTQSGQLLQEWGILPESSPTQQALGAQEDKLTAMLKSFDCAVCLETYDRSDIAQMPDCEHSFCRDCLRTHIQSKLEDRRYPIPCPACSMDNNRIESGHVNQELLQLVGVSQAESDKFQELQLSAHSVEMQCPKCQNTMSVDRQEFLEEKILKCPLPRCGHRWCKACRKEIGNTENNHACKADKLDRLMRRKGWRYCPGCQTPIQRESGCNHMTCTSPGCQMHFCYKCGASIVDASTGQDVGLAVAAHYQTCTQFDKRAKCTIQ